VKKFALVGHPVAHSVSPAIHRTAYRELGFSHEYGLLDAPDEASVAAVFDALRSGELAGVNVTVPWKRLALSLADRRAPSAASVGAANVLAPGSDGVVAHNTDVPALVEELAALNPAPRGVLVLGGGGAALGVVAAARTFGSARVGVSARRFAGDARETWPLAQELTALGAELVAWPAPGNDSEFEAFARGADIVVQATSAGMHGADSGAAIAAMVPWGLLPVGASAYDLVYNPLETEFLRAARAASVTACGGLGMLVRQAALAFEIWLGVRPPLEPLLAAAEAALEKRAQ
jgi:shikimate dehydrogenase